MAALEDTMWWYQAMHGRLIDRMRRVWPTDRGSILDAGCGTGGLLRRIGQQMPGLERIGLEYDAEAATIAVTKSAASVVIGNVNALPFLANSFDVILSADVLYHGQVDDAVASAEFCRCLKSGGSLFLNLPAYNWMKSGHDKHMHTRRRYTARSARRLVEAAGLRVIGAGYWNCLLFPLMVLHRMTTGRETPKSDVQAFPFWLDRLFYAVTVVEKYLAQAGVRLPFGGSVWVSAIKP